MFDGNMCTYTESSGAIEIIVHAMFCYILQPRPAPILIPRSASRLAFGASSQYLRQSRKHDTRALSCDRDSDRDSDGDQRRWSETMRSAGQKGLENTSIVSVYSVVYGATEMNTPFCISWCSWCCTRLLLCKCLSFGFPLFPFPCVYTEYIHDRVYICDARNRHLIHWSI